jgi:putative ABC transport system permease protein
VIRFAVRMAWRETRAGWRHAGALVGCVALGVAALVAVGTFATNLERTVRREARTLLGGDLELRSSRPLEPAARAAIAGLERAGAGVTRLRELTGMARAGSGATLLVEVKAVDARYPLYGALETRPPGPPPRLLGDDGVLVEEGVLQRLGLAPGDPLVIGAARFVIRGVVLREPDRALGISLGPRVVVADGALERTGLLAFGSRVRHRTLLRLPDGVPLAPAREAIAGALSDPGVRVATFEEAQPGLRAFFRQLTSYLGLVGLTSLLVGGIGVAASVAAFLARRLATIAILKCLGATSRALLGTYLLQTLALGLLGSLLGAALGLAVQPLAGWLLAGVVSLALETRPSYWTLGLGIGMGVLTTLLVALWPLLEIRHVPPALILRRDVDAAPARASRARWALVPIAAGLAALAVWQAGSLKLGGLFVGAALVALLTLAALARALRALGRARPRVASIAWRQGLANLHRPGGHAGGVVVALGVGVMLLVAVALLEASLDRHIDHERRRQAPSFFFLDIQPDQRRAFDAVVRAEGGGTAPALTPLVRARLAAVNGEPVTRALLDARKAAGRDGLWYYTRDYALTAAAALPATNALLRGRWWTQAEAAARPRISVEENAARHLGVDVGSTLTFDVQGVPVEAEVMSIRRVDWQTLSTNFFVLFSPGPLDGAPTTYVATARVVPAREAPLQDAVVRAFPNVTAVPVRDVLERAAGILDRIGLAVRAIALFAIAAGLVVMASALAASRYQRLAESVILRTLGATRGAVARIFAVEYACLGATAGLGGTLLAAALAWIVLTWVLDVPWTFEPWILTAGVALTTALALGVGFLATFRLLGQKPLPVLRRE